MTNLKNLGNVADEQVSMHFSGGSDSTLASFLMCERFEKVHLFTFVVFSMDNYDSCQVNVKKLKERFSSEWTEPPNCTKCDRVLRQNRHPV